MNEITMTQWLQGIRAGLTAKDGSTMWVTLENNAWNTDGFHWRCKIGVVAPTTEHFDSGEKSSPEEALIAANEWVANWMHPDKRLAIVLGIEQPIGKVEDDIPIPF